MSRPISRSTVETIVRDVLRRQGLLADDPSRHVEMVFDSDLALALKQEMVDVGRKLWARQDVDGNGGNISCRLTDDWVLCTPHADEQGRPPHGGHLPRGFRRPAARRRAPPVERDPAPPRDHEGRARGPRGAALPPAACHGVRPVGKVPPVAMLAEHEVFIGPVALVLYETPGTQACADAVVPVAAHHNTILMANHGVVTWADSLTHAEWFVEVMDTTCRVLILAAQLGVPPKEIPPAIVGGLLEIKRKMGLTDARFGDNQPPAPAGVRDEQQVRLITDLVMNTLAATDL